MVIRVGWMMAALLGLAAVPAAACSPAPGYVRPSNFELVQLADAIVIATATETVKGEHWPEWRLRVDQTVKGNAPATFVAGYRGRGRPIASRDVLDEPHPEAFEGPCNRMSLVERGTYVFFLDKQGDGSFAPLGYPFTRVNEDYGGEATLWMRTIRAYLDLQRRLDPMAQLAALEARLTELRAGPQTAEARMQAVDIEDHLTSRSPYKPTALLVATYEQLERGERPKYAARSPEADKEQSEAQALTDLMFPQEAAPDAGTVSEEMRFVLSALVDGKHPDALPLFDRLLAAPRLSAWQLAMAIRFLAKNGHYPRAVSLIETRALAMLPLSGDADAGYLVAAIHDAHSGDSYGETPERWEGDAHARATWPEMALALYWWEEARFGRGNARGADTIEKLQTADFRARPSVALVLAANYDDRAEKWAIAELAGKPPSHDPDDEEPAEHADDLPLQMLIRAYGEERDAALAKAFCDGGLRRWRLLRAFAQHGEDGDREFLEQVAATKGLTLRERDLLGSAVAQIYARVVRRARPGDWLSSDGDGEYALLGHVLRGAPGDADPITCPRKR